MRQLLYVILFCSSFFFSCQQEELPQKDTGAGYLSFVEITVQAAEENVISTRAAESDEPLFVDILQGGVVVEGHSYTTETLPSKIKLATGGYTLEIYSSSYKNTVSDTELGVAVYHYSQAFEITESTTTDLGAVQVGMINFGVSLTLPDGFDTWFPTSTFTVTVGGKSKTLHSGDTAYFGYTEGVTASFSYLLEAENADGEAFSRQGSYPQTGLGASSDEPVATGIIYAITYDLATQSLAETHSRMPFKVQQYQ